MGLGKTRAEFRQAQRADDKAAVRYSPSTIVRKHVYKDHNKYSPVNQVTEDDSAT